MAVFESQCGPLCKPTCAGRTPPTSASIGRTAASLQCAGFRSAADISRRARARMSALEHVSRNPSRLARSLTGIAAAPQPSLRPVDRSMFEAIFAKRITGSTGACRSARQVVASFDILGYHLPMMSVCSLWNAASRTPRSDLGTRCLYGLSLPCPFGRSHGRPVIAHRLEAKLAGSHLRCPAPH